MPEDPSANQTEPVDALVANLAGDHEGSSGHFSLSRDKAKESLREFLLSDPLTYVLLLVRGATRRGATRVEVQVDSRSLTMTFDGRPITGADFEGLYDSVFDRKADSLGLRELALGFNAALNLGFGQVRVESGDGGEGATLEMRPDVSDRVSTGKAAVEGTRISIAGQARSSTKRGSEQAELSILRKRCQYASLSLVVNGESVSKGGPGAGPTPQGESLRVLRLLFSA